MKGFQACRFFDFEFSRLARKTRTRGFEEAKLLQRVGARVYGADEVRQRGLAAVLNEAYATVCTGTAGFGITIDLDVLDPCDAPGVKTPATPCA